jgi:hypothetical protein
MKSTTVKSSWLGRNGYGDWPHRNSNCYPTDLSGRSAGKAGLKTNGYFFFFFRFSSIVAILMEEQSMIKAVTIPIGISAAPVKLIQPF